MADIHRITGDLEGWDRSTCPAPSPISNIASDTDLAPTSDRENMANITIYPVLSDIVLFQPLDQLDVTDTAFSKYGIAF
jgi:hypothetical protein